MRREDTIILGGGPAGSAAAIVLASAGQRPLVLERQRETGDALCGGFLSWHSLEALDRLGLDKLRGTTVDRLVMFTPTGSAETPLPRPALGVSRRQLDSALLAKAGALGARVERGVVVREVADRTIRVDGAHIGAEKLLLATGKHDVRGTARPKPGGDPAVGLRVRLRPGAGLSKLVAGAIELHLFDRGYAGIVLQEGGIGNLCLMVRKSRLNEAGTPRALLESIGREIPALADRLAWMADDAEVDAIAAVPYGWSTAHTITGVFRLGDQAGVIPSLAGEGMGIALASGALAAEAILGGRSAEAFQRQLARWTVRPINIASAIVAAAERPRTACLLVKAMQMAPGLATLLARSTRVGT